MIGSVQLSLQIGPVPVPAPREVVEALSAVKVELGSGDTQSGFELTFDLPPLAAAHALPAHRRRGGLPLMRVVLVVTINGRAEPIIDGVTTDCRDAAGRWRRASSSSKGKDLSALMDIIELPATAVSRRCRRRCACW